MRDEKNQRDPIQFVPIGIIHTPFTDITGMPIQPTGARGIRGSVRIFQEYAEGLRDLEGFSHLFLIYTFHRCPSYQLTVTPFLDTTPRGVFATRAPRRPNAIGLSTVRLIEVNGTTLVIEDVDILDGTPLLDLKPYVPAFDSYPDASSGWLEQSSQRAGSFQSDERFR
ncbi:MAG: tRNA (N6-threonylcarbamoyladenosine(37)-N6)-methyltransferase TrmO [Methanoregula sp.]